MILVVVFVVVKDRLPSVPTPVIALKLLVTKLALVITPLATVLATPAVVAKLAVEAKLAVVEVRAEVADPAVVAKLAVDAKLDELTTPTIFAAVKLVMLDPFPLKAVAFTVVTPKVVTPEIGPVKVSDPKVPTPVIAPKLPVTKLALVITPLATVLATPAVVAKLAVDAKLDELTVPTIFAAVKLVNPAPLPVCDPTNVSAFTVPLTLTFPALTKILPVLT